VAAAAGIAASKLVHHFPVSLSQAAGSVVASETRVVHIAKAAGTIAYVAVVTDTAPTGGDKAFTVDVKKSTGGGAFASVLSAVVTVNSSSTSKTPQAGTVSVAAYAAGDVLEIVIAASGSTGTQGYGPCVTVYLQEAVA
jgi:hypothetical protein